MDTTNRTSDEIKAKVHADIERIKAYMPKTYAAIQAKAAEVGNATYGLVKRSCAGEANLFWAIEAGHTAGTPFKLPEVQRDIAHAMVTFGLDYALIWTNEIAGPAAQGGA